MSQLKLVCASVRSRNVVLAITLPVLLTALFAASVRAASDETTYDTFPVSLTPAGELADAGTGESVSISDDGRYVAFRSSATNLGENAPAGLNEAYVKDLDTGALALVSRADGPTGEPASEHGIEDLSISGDGRYVIFASRATNLVAGLPAEESPALHVYRRDLRTGTTALVDRVNGVAGAIVTSEAFAEAISNDGRYVVFSANVEDLEDPAGAHGATGGYTLYVRDTQTGTTTAVGRASGARGAIADEPSIASTISPDGRYVAFESAARNLVPGRGANSVSQIYLRDLQTDTTILVSKAAPTEAAPTGEPADGSSEIATLVGTDGCKVAFESEASNLYSFEESPLITPEVYVADLCSTPASVTLVSRADGESGAPAGMGGAQIPMPAGASADGRYILFSATARLTGETKPETSRRLYLRDLETGHTAVVDRAGGVDGALAQANPDGSAISANGCRVVFATQATNLSALEAPGDPTEIYARQLGSCLPPVEAEHHEGTVETGTGGNGGGEPLRTSGPTTTIAPPTIAPPSISHGARAITHLAIAGLSPARMLLRLTGPGRATVKLARRVGKPRQRRWRNVRTIAVKATKAGRVSVKLGSLPPGRYRVSIQLAGGRRLLRSLTVTRAER
jgi:hypothetical protein